MLTLCHELAPYGRELLAVDGTRINAVNSRQRNFTGANLNHRLKKVVERLESCLKEMNQAAAENLDGCAASVNDLASIIEALRQCRATLQAQGKTLEQIGDNPLSLTDPDARAMDAQTAWRPPTPTFAPPANASHSPTCAENVRNLPRLHYVNLQAYRACPMKGRCTTTRYRAIVRHVNEADIDRMGSRIAKACRRPEATPRGNAGSILSAPSGSAWERGVSDAAS